MFGTGPGRSGRSGGPKGKLVRTKAPSVIAGSTGSMSAQQSPQGPGAAGMAIFGFIGFANQRAGGFIPQFRGSEHVDDAFRVVAGLQVTLDQHLQIAGNGSMFGGGDVLDTVPDVAPKTHRYACKRLGGAVVHGPYVHHFGAKDKDGRTMPHPETWLKVLPAGLFCEPGGFFIDPLRPVDRAVITHGHSDHARAGHRCWRQRTHWRSCGRG